MHPQPHLIDVLHAQALSALSVPPGARGYSDDLRARETGHDDAMRRVVSRLDGILHGCLKTGREYDEVHRMVPPCPGPGGGRERCDDRSIGFRDPAAGPRPARLGRSVRPQRSVTTTSHQNVNMARRRRLGGLVGEWLTYGLS